MVDIVDITRETILSILPNITFFVLTPHLIEICAKINESTEAIKIKTKAK